MADLSGRVVAITGATGGIGYAATLELSRRGAQVVAGYATSLDVAECLRAEAPGPVTLVRGDVTDETHAVALTATAVKEYGRLDVLINNAGITRDKLLVRMTEEDWDAVMHVNLKGAFLCTKHALKPMMRQRYGKIINVSSIAAVLGNGGQANYAASKAGLIGLTHTVAQEYSSYGIRGITLVPGIIASGLSISMSESFRTEKLANILLGPGPQSQVAATLAFLASADADYINAAVIRLDGGIRF